MREFLNFSGPAKITRGPAHGVYAPVGHGLGASRE
jgi:hypothetical protein